MSSSGSVAASDGHEDPGEEQEVPVRSVVAVPAQEQRHGPRDRKQAGHDLRDEPLGPVAHVEHRAEQRRAEASAEERAEDTPPALLERPDHGAVGGARPEPGVAERHDPGAGERPDDRPTEPADGEAERRAPPGQPALLDAREPGQDAQAEDGPLDPLTGPRPVDAHRERGDREGPRRPERSEHDRARHAQVERPRLEVVVNDHARSRSPRRQRQDPRSICPIARAARRTSRPCRETK